MATMALDLSGGLTPEHELFFPSKPEDPEMRESSSIWLMEENGAFGFPRVGIEGEAHSWDSRLYHANIAMGGGRILHGTGRGAVPSPIGSDGRPTIFGAGPLTFRMIEPFRRWLVTYDGTVVEGTVGEQIAGQALSGAEQPLRFEVELEMVTPGWVQDNSPEKVARMSPAEAADAASMGIGWRIEHLFRAQGTLDVDGTSRDFRATGLRIKRQSVRPLAQFRGHCWQSAVFPDGSAFGYIAYPPASDGSEPYNDGYIYRDGRMYPARATRMPWLRRLLDEGDDATMELESELGTTRIEGKTTLSTFRIHNAEMADGRFNLQQTGVRYSWDGQIAYGMLERSSTDDQMGAH
jgi:hypothetical protein